MITTHKKQDDKTLEIRITDRFDFSVLRDFRDAYESAGKDESGYIVDLKETTYMDSSALGMLLQLREFAGDRKDNVKIVNANTEIRNILSIANFDKLMTIS